MAPSRELALQIYNVLVKMCAAVGAISLLPRVVFGLEKFPAPFHKITDVLITTPTAFQENESRELYMGCHQLILDEADWLLADAVSVTMVHILETFAKAYEPKSKPEHPFRVMFVAATIPNVGKSIGAYLEKNYPKAEWISGSFLHRHKPNLKQTWVEVPTESWELAKLGLWRLTEGEMPKDQPTEPPKGSLPTPVTLQRLQLLLEHLGNSSRRTIIFCLNLASCQQVFLVCLFACMCRGVSI